jgi:hypothetical protein
LTQTPWGHPATGVTVPAAIGIIVRLYGRFKPSYVSRLSDEEEAAEYRRLGEKKPQWPFAVAYASKSDRHHVGNSNHILFSIFYWEGIFPTQDFINSAATWAWLQSKNPRESWIMQNSVNLFWLSPCI